jgi:diguanylate cyclase (GGDEF)-like protein/PAS domain S-box-containing protein
MVGPFACLSVVGLAASFLLPTYFELTLGLICTGLTGALIAVSLFAPWHRLPGWTQAICPLLYLGVVALLRESTGGSASGLGALVLLPVIWFGLYGTRRQVAMAVAGVGCVFFLPVALGSPDYPPQEWVRGGVWVAVSSLVGFTIQGLISARRRQAEELTVRATQLEKSTQLFEGVLGAATEYSIIGTDAQGTIEVFNTGAERMLGYSAEEMIGRETPAIIHDPAEVAQRAEEMGVEPGFEVMVASARGGAPETRRWTYVRKDGEPVPVELTVSPVTGADREVKGFIGIASDVGERVRSDTALRASEGALLAVSRVSKDIANSRDARKSVCEAALEVCEADLAVLMEPDGEHHLKMTASSGIELPSIRIALGREASGSALVFASGDRMFVPEAVGDPAVSARVIQILGAKSVLFEPVRRDGETVGVLTIAWRSPRPELGDRVGIAAGLLASDAGVAIERSDLLARLEGAALTDSLTGLANRRAWDETVPEALMNAADAGRPTSIAMLDLDHFKAYNDRHGHQAGDRLLVEISAAWREQMREGDVLARYGGEEFTLLLPNCNASDARAVLERVRRSVPDSITCSAGLAVIRRHESAETAVARADVALYAAKERGRDTLVEYSEIGVGETNPAET